MIYGLMFNMRVTSRKIHFLFISSNHTSCFKKMVSKVNAEVASFLMKCTIPSNPNEQKSLEQVNRTIHLKEQLQKKELKTLLNNLLPLEADTTQGLLLQVEGPAKTTKSESN